jgi:hypothetical protein
MAKYCAVEFEGLAGLLRYCWERMARLSSAGAQCGSRCKASESPLPPPHGWRQRRAAGLAFQHAQGVGGVRRGADRVRHFKVAPGGLQEPASFLAGPFQSVMEIGPFPAANSPERPWGAT